MLHQETVRAKANYIAHTADHRGTAVAEELHNRAASAHTRCSVAVFVELN